VNLEDKLESHLKKALTALALVFLACVVTLMIAGTAWIVFLTVTNMRSW